MNDDPVSVGLSGISTVGLCRLRVTRAWTLVSILVSHSKCHFRVRIDSLDLVPEVEHSVAIFLLLTKARQVCS
jgi:hypothetical protein